MANQGAKKRAEDNKKKLAILLSVVMFCTVSCFSDGISQFHKLMSAQRTGIRRCIVWSCTDPVCIRRVCICWSTCCRSGQQPPRSPTRRQLGAPQRKFYSTIHYGKWQVRCQNVQIAGAGQPLPSEKIGSHVHASKQRQLRSNVSFKCIPMCTVCFAAARKFFGYKFRFAVVSNSARFSITSTPTVVTG
jgi:hypothetical protein